MTTTAAEFRALHAGDAAAAATLIRTAFASFDPPLNPAPSALRETADTITAQLARGGGHGAFGGQRLVAVLMWEICDGGLYLGRLSVEAAWRRHGLARRLIDIAETEARLRGTPRLHAGVRLALQPNRALFAAAGFSETKLHAHEGFAVPTWVELEKPLG